MRRGFIDTRLAVTGMGLALVAGLAVGSFATYSGQTAPANAGEHYGDGCYQTADPAVIACDDGSWYSPDGG